MMVVDIKNIVTRLPELRFTAPVNWRIDEGQQWAVVGPNGAGKTLIADIMQRKFAFKEGEVVFSGDGKVSDFIKSIAFKPIKGLSKIKTRGRLSNVRTIKNFRNSPLDKKINRLGNKSSIPKRVNIFAKLSEPAYSFNNSSTIGISSVSVECQRCW